MTASTAGPAGPGVHVGVGVDCSRYGHVAHFSRSCEGRVVDAAPPLRFTEAADGYLHFRRRFERILESLPDAVFVLRVDAAGLYAVNLEAWLRRLPFRIQLSFGDSRRNGAYRRVHFPSRKSDAVDSAALARFALVERPPHEPAVPDRLLVLREVVSRLQAASTHRTRLLNQLHNLLSRVFPELAKLSSDLHARWVLRLLARHPTPELVAAAGLPALARIPCLKRERAERIVEAAKASIASVRGAEAARLVQIQVERILQTQALLQQLAALTGEVYRGWDERPALTSIPGIGPATAAALAAKVVSIDRFRNASALTAYFGVFPGGASSGVTPEGAARPTRSRRMSKQGNGLVRSLIYNCARSAIRCNPACRALFLRLRARGTRSSVALGHVMRKLLHLVYAVWKTGRPFDPKHHRWEEPEEAGSAARRSPAGAG